MEIDKLLEMYKSMFRIRRVEEAISEEYTKQEMRCPTHLCIGQEAIATGICLNLHATDKVFSGHRAHGHYLAKGGDLNAFIAELYGCSNGCSKGYGGSMHLTDLDAGFIGSTPIVGGTIPLAVGSAWRAKLLDENDITVVFFGEGCFEEGVLHESLNFSKLHNLPVLFVCENNLYSVYTQLKDRQPENRTISQIVQAHGIESYRGDGNNVVLVNELAEKAIEQIRNNNGPVFLELHTYRWLEHCGPYDDDNLNYRPSGELDSWKEKCPLKRAHTLLEPHIDSEMLTKLENDVNREITSAFKFSENCPKPLLNKQSEISHYA